MRSPVRLAILACDTPLPNTKSKYGGYGGVFEALLRAGVKASGYPDSDSVLQFSNFQVELYPDKYPDLDDIDAVLITGSRHNSFEDVPWINTLVDYTAKILAQDRVRMIGVCFGHQIIGRALGVKVGRNDKGWEASVNEVELSPTGKELFGKDKLNLHQMHRDMVYYYPQGVEELGSSPICKVQGMYAPRRFITVQGHPEFTQEIMSEIIESRHKIGIFDEAAYKEAMGKSPKAHDGLVVSKAFVKFLLED